MDLNTDNYTEVELLNFLKVDNNNVNNNILQQIIINKIDKIKKINQNILPESREDIIEFYIKVFFKLSNFINEKNRVENNSKNILQPKLEKSEVVQESNNFIIKRQDENVQNNFEQKFKRGIINPLQVKSVVQMININTRFRNNYTNSLSTNFIYTLPSTIKKIISMKIIDIQLANAVYTYSDKIGSNNFKITQSGVTTTIDISNGSYTNSELINAINTSLTNNGITNISIGSNPINFLMDISSNDGSVFDIDFNYSKDNCPQLLSNINKNQLTLGWIMGFRGNYLQKINAIKNKHGCYVENHIDISNNYSGKSNYTAESVYEEHFNKYFLISIEDYQNNHINSFVSPFQFQSLADNNILGKIHSHGSECNPYTKNDMVSPKRIYFGPTDINRLHIILYDEVGRILDINNSDYSLTLELEIIYDY